VAYWREPEHKEKKRDLNAKRQPCRPPRRQAPATPPAATKIGSGKPTSTIIEYVRMVISLIEGRRISRRQVLLMLERIVRQHTIGKRRKIDHAVAWLNEQPP